MNRRRFLARAALPCAVGPTVLAAGCLSAGPTPLSGPTPDPHPRRVTVADVSPLPDELAFSIDAEMRTSEVTDDHPATLALAATNEGERRAVSVGAGMCRPFNRSRGRSEAGGLWLYAAGEEPNPRVEGRWKWNPEGEVGYPLYGCLMRTWAAGESRTYAYAVWSDFDTDGYFEPGTYRWELPVRVAPVREDDGDENTSDGEESTTEAGAEATWALELRVAVPE